ncbi:MAG: arylsulfatase A-like enzyme, partial [Rhodothermales bacterium]
MPQRFFLLVFLHFTISVIAAERPAQPNVVLILTDDLGWQDVKCYDVDEPSPMETPNIDALAKKGMMFWQAYSPAPTCAPSRCAIMSGVHPARAQKTHVVGGAPPAPVNKHFRVMPPWYSGRMPADELTLAKILRQHGYRTGHSGKWHMAIDHHSFPQPEDQGFDYTRATRGARGGMKNRLADFATGKAGDPFRLDENGYPFHQTNEDALSFLREQTDKPFFLYYATWLVHTPIHTRSKALLDKYVEKLGVDPAALPPRETPGQTNPFYCAMVEELDYYLGTIFDYLDQTDDPRWPGHKLSENTYLIFTSDNGGMEGGQKESYTDNYPLDRGKISAMEGGTRVPLIITGPGIPAGVQSDVMVNGLDFYPSILSMTGIAKPEDKQLDGCDLTPLLLQGDAVKRADGRVRDTMVWHFPHSVAHESTIRVGDYKLVRNYDPKTVPLELYRLYETKNGVQQRVDIEEAKNLAEAMPEKARKLDGQLSEILGEMKASLPYHNPNCHVPLPNQDKVCSVLRHQQKGKYVHFTFQEKGAKVTGADLIYTRNGGERYEEWFRAPAKVRSNSKASAEIPPGTTHYFLNLIDENRFLRSYPEVVAKGKIFADSAIAVTEGPQTFDELWEGYDPRAEPLDVEVLKEWEEDGVQMQVLRYRVGRFKNQKSMMAAVYGYPKGAKKLPGLVQIHGGGQYADAKAVLTNAKRGYATISIAWAGRISAKDYRVSPNEVQLFWDGATDNPAYRVTTDWGALEAYHAPSKYPKNAFPAIPAPAEWTLDPVVSPRNNSWYLCTLAARRALTFLERQAQVDPERLGVYGHSMGGKLTVLTTGSDSRVKAAAPSCGGISDRYNKDPLFRATIGDDAYLRRIACPIIFLSPANDFHGRIPDLQTAFGEIKSKDWRMACAPHHNHQDTDAYEVATQLWFDQHLKGSFSLPQTPQSELKLGDVPSFSVRPDSSKRILSVDIYYSQQGDPVPAEFSRTHSIARFWHHAEATQAAGAWSAELPNVSGDKPLWVYANVSYPLDSPVTGAGYYYGAYSADRFTLSSRMSMVAAAELSKSTRAPSLLIEDFEGDWEKEWFSYKPEQWPRKTHKVYDSHWAAPDGAKLSIEVLSTQPNTLVVGIDSYAVERPLKGEGKWQSIVLSAADFLNSESTPLANWNGIEELRLADRETFRAKGKVKARTRGATWKGP